ncbi:lipid-A-disaccharide kinase [Desulfacinum hydrothermale DSM 13146]|uniref:Tetraacyldisaccharide 4'-kinase n=1 Tax=Desulfacinum hydrothermale DSM 13146 TaxID=1121390 RepID=A0A1W1XVC9_9BACT|nr:tetraacyldisaccharide 4'-kinase [Desulfacinum hydrothermale]SMC27488.1 lipid-A-disaccharide kinase [Desulfacinum hydrothermale DSM 13146]
MKPFLENFLEKAAQRIWYGSSQDPVGRVLSSLLSPAQALYLLGLRRDQAARRARRKALPVPVVSVGNLTVGGTGKTPLVRWIARYWTRRGVPVAVLSRGYGRRHAGSFPVRVSCGGERQALAARYGDEPVMLACGSDPVPVWVGRDRWKAGMGAIRGDRARVLVLDDGFQYVQLARSLDVLVLDACRPLGNGRLLPAGPLREPPQALQRAQVIVFMEPPTGCPAEGVDWSALRDKTCVRARPVVRGFLRAGTGESVEVRDLARDGVVTVCGIARPQRFLATLKAQGIASEDVWIFGDHHRFRPTECRRVLQALRRRRARWVVTTEKDAVRLSPPLLERAVFPLLDLDFGTDGPKLTARLDALFPIGN